MKIQYLILVASALLLLSACSGGMPAQQGTLSPSPIVITVIVSPTPEATAMPVETPFPTQSPTPSGPTPTPLVIPTPEAVVTYPWINLRKGPGSWYELLTELDQGTRVAVLAQYDNCAWLYVSTAEGMTGWLIANPEYLELNTSCEALPQGAYRPATSVIRPNVRGGGSGELEINNETPEDAVVILTWDGYPVYAAYIRSRETFYMSGVADGQYDLYFCHGSDWNGSHFLQEVSYRHFTRTMDFLSDAETYTAWTVTLHGVDGGGTPDTEEVPAGTFPQW